MLRVGAEGAGAPRAAKWFLTPFLDGRLMVSVLLSIMPDAEVEAGVMATCHPGKGLPDPPG